MKFKFTGTAVVEATSEEDALNQIGAHLSARSRHLGNGVKLDKTAPFFTLAEVAKGEAVDLAADPVAEKARAAEAKAATTAEARTATAVETTKQ